MIRGCLSAAFVIFVWGVTFANTRALLFDFSALEIQVVRFVMAWAALWGMERAAFGCLATLGCSRRSTPAMRSRMAWRDEVLFAAMVSWGVYSVLIDKVNARGYSQPDDVVVYYPFLTSQGTVDAIYVRNGASSKSLVGSDRDQFIRERTRRQVLTNVNAVVAQNPAEIIDQVIAAINSAFAAQPQVRNGANVVVTGGQPLTDARGHRRVSRSARGLGWAGDLALDGPINVIEVTSRRM